MILVERGYMIKELKKSLETQKLLIKQWEGGFLTLNKKEVDKMYENVCRWEDELKKACTHERCQIFVSSWTDKGMGLDRDYYEYRLRCHDCNTDLGDISPARSYDTFKSQIAPILDLVKANPDLFTENALKRLNIQKVEHKTITYSYTKGY